MFGKKSQVHTEQCRARLEVYLKDTDRYKAARKRELEFYEKVLQAEEKRRRAEGEIKKMGLTLTRLTRK